MPNSRKLLREFGRVWIVTKQAGSL